MMRREDLRSHDLVGYVRTNWQDEIRKPPVRIRIGSEIIALRTPHVNKRPLSHQSDLSQETEFSIPFLPACAYAGLFGDCFSGDVVIEFEEESIGLENIAQRNKDVGTFRSLMFHDYPTIRLTDVWYSGSHQLRLRLFVDKSGGLDAFNNATLKVFQSDTEQKTPARLICRHAIERHGISFISIDLLNHYQPLLFSLFDSSNESLLLDLLPFPSLCRGGRHYAELRSLGWTGRYLDDLRLTNDALIREHIGWGALHPQHTIRNVVINTDRSTGAEPACAAELHVWMQQIFGTGIMFRGGGRTNVSHHCTTDP